jgi:DNA-binding NtrC family response regulator
MPLREHPMDILPLAEYFLESFAKSERLKKEGLSEPVKRELLSYEYPGNIRELQNLVRRATILCKDGPILPIHLGISININNQYEASDDLQETDKEYTSILNVLVATRWNRREAAKKLGIPYSTLRFRMMKLGIK